MGYGCHSFVQHRLHQLDPDDERFVSEIEKSLYNVISRDQRHNQIIPLLMQNIPQRSFESWSMGYSTLTSREFNHIKEIAPVVKNPYTQDTGSPNVVLDLIKTFYKNNYRN